MKKIITGRVVQEWDEGTKLFVSQEFIADEFSYEDDDGEELSSVYDPDFRKAYLPMDMVQPSADTIKEWIRTGNLNLEEEDAPMTVKGLLEEAGLALDNAYSYEIMGEILFRGTDGKVYEGSVDFIVNEANPDRVKEILEDE